MTRCKCCGNISYPWLIDYQVSNQILKEKNNGAIRRCCETIISTIRVWVERL